MATPHLTIRPGNPDFLDLPWGVSIVEWEDPRIVELPTGVHRHEIVFVAYPTGTFAIKELPYRYAANDHHVLRDLHEMGAPVVEPVGLVERTWIDPHHETSAAVITRYHDFAFSYRELISGGGFGQRRNQLLDGFAGLLVELHLAGCFWGDCSLSNVLYRWDAATIEVTMVDAETSALYPELTEGQRLEDLEIMIMNVAGGIADIAAEQNIEIDAADLALGEDIAGRYHGLWEELTGDVVILPDERYRIDERIRRLNDLGFQVADIEMVPEEGGNRLRLRVKVGGRTFHSTRLRELTRIEASENQARQILSDVYHYEAIRDANSPSLKAVAAVQWRVGVFEPMLEKIRDLQDEGADPVQGFCDFLYHRYVLSYNAGKDFHNEEAFESWVAAGLPGYPAE